MLEWLTRCLPGFSIIGLGLLLTLAFSDLLRWQIWTGVFPPWMDQPFHSGWWSGLNLAQSVFVAYAVLIHVQMFGFTCRLGWTMFRVTAKVKETALRRPKPSPLSSPSSRISDEGYASQQLSPISLPSPSPLNEKINHVMLDEMDDFNREELIHAIILPNYCEDLHTLETTLKVLECHPRAQSQYEIYLAMEQKEAGSVEKADQLIKKFEQSFRHIRPTFHPSGIEGEIAGKSSNVAFAAQQIVDIHQAYLKTECCNVVVTVMDADTHLSRDYFTEIRRLHYEHLEDSDRAVYCCPIIFDRNSHETNVIVRSADLLWSFAGMSTMFPGTMISIPTSVYSLPLSLAQRVGGWDSGPTAIGEDMHMLLKCYFETAGNVVSRVVYVPASQCNISSDSGKGWRHVFDTCVARYGQALRHMWGSLDSGFAVRRTLGYLNHRGRSVFLHPRHFALLNLLWEAHFLPCHLVITLIFSALYTAIVPAAQIHPTLKWAFSLNDVFRTSSFIGMNICLALNERLHAFCLHARMQDMREANLPDTGCAERTWYKPQFLLERICFPIAGTLYGAIPALHAIVFHFWTDRLVYRVSKKPTFAADAAALA